jgi:sulfate adenylyltransferase
LSPELGFSRADRLLHLRRMGSMAAAVARRGGIAVCAAIAPFSEGRDVMRVQAEAAGIFVVVHVATPLHICEARDSKQLYARARAGLLDRFTGVSDPYEVPDNPDLTVDTVRTAPRDAAGLVVSRLVEWGCLDARHRPLPSAVNEGPPEEIELAKSPVANKVVPCRT